MGTDSYEDDGVDWATIEAELSAPRERAANAPVQPQQAAPKRSAAHKQARPAIALVRVCATHQARRDAEALAHVWTEELRAANAALERKCALLSQQLTEVNRRSTSQRIAQQRSNAQQKETHARERDAARGRALELVAQHRHHALATLPLHLGLSRWRAVTKALYAPETSAPSGARSALRLACAVAALYDLRLNRSLSAWLGATRGMRQAHALAHGVASAAVRAEREHAARVASAVLVPTVGKSAAARSRALGALLRGLDCVSLAAAVVDWKCSAEHARAGAIGRAWSHACGALLLDRCLLNLLGRQPTARCLNAWRESVAAASRLDVQLAGLSNYDDIDGEAYGTEYDDDDDDRGTN
jgi:hypothetical protein